MFSGGNFFFTSLSPFFDSSSNLMELTARILTLAAQHQGDAENLNRSMLAQLSHELRTPLNDVIDFNTLLLEAAEPEKRNLVEGSLNSARTLRDVIDNVLLSSKMQVFLETKI